MPYRLPAGVRPTRVELHVDVDPQRSDAFSGEVAHHLVIERRRRSIRLHAADLRVSKARLEWPGGGARGRVEAIPAVEMIEVHFERPPPKGAVTLRLAFAGRLRKDLCGLYGASVGSRRYAFSQLEATDARKFFPCFDEPAMKARFAISVTTGARNAVVSNAPAIRTHRRARGSKTVEFAETPPLSTYLVALAVGGLERSRPAWVGPTEIRIWHTPGQRRLTGFGLEAARECLARLERWFGLPYPYAKLDLVAVPDFEFGAMENAGAVFFRETLLLLDSATSTLTERKRAAEVIAHELAHMWYGNLVTMAWWDDLWLNEAFATWMAYAIVDDWKPEWKMWHDFQHGSAAALELDALVNTHPIYCPVRTAAEASENFDLITYEKGAAVVRMLERYLGAATFRRGVRRYIRRHREGNTRADDLWTALSEASGEDVTLVARAWIEQPGHPRLQVRRSRDGHSLELRQERFATDRRRRRAAARWPIPWVGRVGGAKRGSRLERQLLTRARERVALPRGGARFVYGNAEEGGFFRPHHDEAGFAALLGSLPALAPVERMGLADHQWALVRAGHAGIGSFLDLAIALADDGDADVLITLHRPLQFVVEGLAPDALPRRTDDLKALLAARFGPAFASLGWRPLRGESESTRMRRAALLGIAGGIAEAPEILDAAPALCGRYLASRRSIDANLADGIVGLAARSGDAKLHRRLRRAARDASTPQEQRRFLLALGDFRDPARISETLDLALTDAVATQDVVFLLARLFANPVAREPTWDFVRTRWSRLRRRVPPLLASRLVESTWLLLTAAHRREVADFFREHPVQSGERALQRALERFDWYRSFRRPASRALRDWIDRDDQR